MCQDAVAPVFAVFILVFLLAFAAYVILAVVALVLDQQALFDVCAQDYWVWLYVFLALAVPTLLGVVMGCVRQSFFPFFFFFKLALAAPTLLGVMMGCVRPSFLKVMI